MKYLYLLGSVMRSWFYKEQRKYTVSAILMFFFSAILMLFVASALGSDILWSVEEEEQANSTYSFYVSDEDGKLNLLTATERVFDTLFSLNSNNIDSVAVFITNCYDNKDTIGSKEIGSVEVMPVLKEDYGSNLLFSMWLGNDNLAYLNVPYQSEQNIAEGTEITMQQLEEGENVIVLPEDYGVKVGERVVLFSEDFLVVGITADEFVRVSSSFLEKFAVESSELIYKIYNIDFDKPMTDETYNALNQILYETAGSEIAFYEGVTLSDDPKLAYALMMAFFGMIIALFSVFGIYYPTLRLFKDTAPILSVFKLCGMRIMPIFGLLLLPVLFCYAVPFGLASVVLILTEDIFSRCLLEYELRDFYFGISAVIFILTAAVAIVPPMIKMAKSQPSEEVEI